MYRSQKMMLSPSSFSPPPPHNFCSLWTFFLSIKIMFDAYFRMLTLEQANVTHTLALSSFLLSLSLSSIIFVRIKIIDTFISHISPNISAKRGRDASGKPEKSTLSVKIFDKWIQTSIRVKKKSEMAISFLCSSCVFFITHMDFRCCCIREDQ